MSERLLKTLRNSGDFQADYERSIPFTRFTARFSAPVYDFARLRSLDGSILQNRRHSNLVI